MNKSLLYLFVLLFPLSLFSQSDTLVLTDTTYFSNAIRINLAKYKIECAHANRTGDFERSKFLFDSLVQNRLTGTKFDDFALKRVNKSKIQLSSIHKPIVFVTYASWCVTSQGEIPALNKLAQKYGKDVQFVVLFWDRRGKMKKLAKKFNHRVIVCYAHESYKDDSRTVGILKHTLGLPNTFFLDENLKVSDIKRCGVQVSLEKANYQKGYALNYNSFLEGMVPFLLNKELEKEMLVIK
jgi:thiol-disulfide isomerase/thioredoxin